MNTLNSVEVIEKAKLDIEAYITENNLVLDSSIQDLALKIAEKKPNYDFKNFLIHAQDTEYLETKYKNSLRYTERFKAEFTQKDFFTKDAANLKNISIDENLKVGAKVTFTNDYGVSFPNSEILGFDKEYIYNRCIYINNDSYWFAVTPDSLTVQDKFIGLPIQFNNTVVPNQFYVVETCVIYFSSKGEPATYFESAFNTLQECYEYLAKDRGFPEYVNIQAVNDLYYNDKIDYFVKISLEVESPKLELA